VDLFMKEPIQNVKRFCLLKIELLERWAAMSNTYPEIIGIGSTVYDT